MENKFGPSGSGKTDVIIKQAAFTGGYIVAPHLDWCSMIAERAKELKLNIRFPITFDDFINK